MEDVVITERREQNYCYNHDSYSNVFSFDYAQFT
jgi:hypothetical protein